MSFHFHSYTLRCSFFPFLFFGAHAQAKSLIRGGSIVEFVDPKLNAEYSSEAFDMTFKLAVSCTSLKRKRPSMEQVVQTLEEALNMSTRETGSTPYATPDHPSTP